MPKIENAYHNHTLVIDDDSARSKSFAMLLGFINCNAEMVTPEELQELNSKSLQKYSAIFSIDKDDIKAFFNNLNKQDKNQYPLVKLSEQEPSDRDQLSQSAPYVSSLSFNADYPALSNVLAHLRLKFSKGSIKRKRGCQPLIGTSHATQRINHMIGQVANSTATVLILGESGTGKEVIARNIHAQSDRHEKPFVPINCGAIPPDLLESELFGHEKGAFTGAISTRQGRFELAEGGVIFLDEIGDMPLPMQVKLLRVLQERSFERVGSNQTINCDVRVIAATHRNLDELISQGKFREDLYYRLNVFPIDVPALKERIDDLTPILHELISRNEQEQRGSVRLSVRATKMLQKYSWPGNVRELANLVERLAILYPHGVVDARDLPGKYQAEDMSELVEEPVSDESFTMMNQSGSDQLQLPSAGLDLKQHVTNIEISLIEQALEQSNNVVARAANLLKVRRTTLVEKMRKYAIERS